MRLLVCRLIIHLFLEDLHISNIVLALGEFLCFEDVLAILSNRNAPVFVPDFDLNGLLSGSDFPFKEERSNLRWQETVLDELLDIVVVLNDFNLLAHHFGSLLDGGSLLADRKPHITGVDHKDEAGIALVHHTVAASRAGQALELGDQAHTVFSKFYFDHIMPSSGTGYLIRPGL